MHKILSTLSLLFLFSGAGCVPMSAPAQPPGSGPEDPELAYMGYDDDEADVGSRETSSSEGTGSVASVSIHDGSAGGSREAVCRKFARCRCGTDSVAQCMEQPVDLPDEVFRCIARQSCAALCRPGSDGLPDSGRTACIGPYYQQATAAERARHAREMDSIGAMPNGDFSTEENVYDGNGWYQGTRKR